MNPGKLVWWQVYYIPMVVSWAHNPHIAYVMAGLNGIVRLFLANDGRSTQGLAEADAPEGG
jgi:hypothetical protein